MINSFFKRDPCRQQHLCLGWCRQSWPVGPGFLAGAKLGAHQSQRTAISSALSKSPCTPRGTPASVCRQRSLTGVLGTFGRAPPPVQCPDSRSFAMVLGKGHHSGRPKSDKQRVFSRCSKSLAGPQRLHVRQKPFLFSSKTVAAMSGPPSTCFLGPAILNDPSLCPDIPIGKV